MLDTSFWMLVAGVAQTVVTQIERLAVGRIADINLVGFYSVSKDLAHIFIHEISVALDRVLLVSLSRAVDAYGEAREQFVSAIGAYALIAAPMSLGLSATAYLLVPIVLGSQWTEAVVLLQPLAVAVGFQAIYTGLTPVLIAMRRVRYAGLANVAWAILLTAAVSSTAFLTRDPLAVAWTALTVNAAFLMVALAVIATVVGVPLVRVVSAVARPYVAAGVMYLVVTHVPVVVESVLAIGLAELIAIGASVYGVAIALLWLVVRRPAGIEQQLFEQAKTLIAKRLA